MLQANCQNLDAYSEAERNPCCKVQILVVAQQFLLYSSNASTNTTKNVSKLLRIGDLASNSGANQDKACPVSKVPTKPTHDLSVGYR